MKRILQIDMHPTVGTQLNYSVKSWKWGKEMIELKLDNGNLVQINPSYVIAIVCEEVEEEGIDFDAQWEHVGATRRGTDNS
jgi:hypothetical protein